MTIINYHQYLLVLVVGVVVLAQLLAGLIRVFFQQDGESEG